MSAEREREQERRLNLLDRRLRLAEDRIAEAQQEIPRIQAGGAGNGGGGPSAPYYCVGDGTAHVATGTWPSLTVVTFTSDVYKLDGSTWTLVKSAATVNWPYKDALSTTAGKLIPCWPNEDNTTFNAVVESCTVVT